MDFSPLATVLTSTVTDSKYADDIVKAVDAPPDGLADLPEFAEHAMHRLDLALAPAGYKQNRSKLHSIVNAVFVNIF